MLKNFSKFLFVSILFFSCSVNAYYDLGQPTGFVNDYANVLSLEQKQSLENKLIQFEENSGKEIAVVVIKNLQGDYIENFAVDLFKNWGIGKKGEDNGVLILVAQEDREMRIEVGYGLEGSLTDAQSSWIINQIMKPAFQQDDFFSGINGAVDKIILATQGEIIPTEKENKKSGLMVNSEFFIWLIIVVFMWLASILGRSKSWWLGGVIGGIIGVIIGFIKGFLFLGVILTPILVLLGLLFDYKVSKDYKKAKDKGSYPWWIGGGKGGGFGGGGFGGFGGGMSGGGGSSGRW